jgi:hypothetical protein
VGYARDTEELAAAWFARPELVGSAEGPAVTRWARSYSLEASATDSSFVIEAAGRKAPGVWFRIAVDRQARRVRATCGGDPTEYCMDGHWPIESFGLYESYVFGR